MIPLRALLPRSGASAAGALAAPAFALSFAFAALAADRPLVLAKPGAGGARNLTLAPELSFTDDSSSNFPIRGEDLNDGRIASDRPTVVFFGTSHCWNTNREAERLVSLYSHEKDVARFVIVDLNRPSADQKPLIRRYYHGSIPTVAFFDHSGRVTYDEAGETASQRGDWARLADLLKKAAGSGSASADPRVTP